jgi:glycosyltransferase involved in cell wall biosynthesis
VYGDKEIARNDKITVRYIGNFYGCRQPHGFLKALQQFPHEQRPQIRIEFIGSSTQSLRETIRTLGLDDVVFTFPPVSYRDSLRLMSSADILLVIDAPTEKNPFLPSKLIDYIGASKPILGITPPGTSQKLIEEMGFLVAHPDNLVAIVTKLMQTIEKVSKKNSPCIPVNIRNRYLPSVVGERMRRILEKPLQNLQQGERTV